MADISDLAHRAGQIMDEARNRVLAPFGLTPRQYLLLQCFAAADGISQTDAVDATGVDRSTLADVTRRLLGNGFIRRKRTRHDARRYEIRVTEHGMSVLEKAKPLIAAADAAVLGGLSDIEQTRLSLMLEKIAAPPARNGKAA